MYIVLKTFKCRFHDFKVFKEGNEYDSVNEAHTKKLVELGYIKKIKPAKKQTKKATEAKKDDKAAKTDKADKK